MKKIIIFSIFLILISSVYAQKYSNESIKERFQVKGLDIALMKVSNPIARERLLDNLAKLEDKEKQKLENHSDTIFIETPRGFEIRSKKSAFFLGFIPAKRNVVFEIKGNQVVRKKSFSDFLWREK